jgi:predicted AAA+ superfamily ATPase
MRNSFTGYTDKGSLVENAVYIHLSSLYGNDNVFYLSDKSGEVDFLVELDINKIMLVESKYNNLKESILNTLSDTITTEVYGKKVVERKVITDGISSNEVIRGKTIELISLKEFLYTDPV